MIQFNTILWDDPAKPRGNVQHIAAHGLTPDEVESVLRNPNGQDGRSASSGRPLRYGWTNTGRHIVIAYEIRQTRATVAITPVTAYEVPPF